jgi:hypothetical protein
MWSFLSWLCQWLEGVQDFTSLLKYSKSEKNKNGYDIHWPFIGAYVVFCIEL